MIPLYAQVVTTKKPNGQTYRYLRIVESYRDGKTVKKRQVASLGNIDEYSEKEIQQIIRTLESLLPNRTLGSAEDLQPLHTLQFGVPHVVQVLWDQLGMSSIIETALHGRQVTFDVARYLQAMVINRLVDPSSKLRLFQTLADLYLPEGDQEPWQLQHFYRTLDLLMDIKPQVEKAIYARLTDLLNFRLTLVLCDLTSTQVTGHHCPIAKHGYSRTHRPDLEQVELGLLVTPEGLPITHEVFPGNTSDKQTVPEILEQLKRDFAVNECVFVGDRGMVTKENLTLLCEAGYPYIVGYHKRGRIVSDRLLERYQDLSAFTPLYDQLAYLEIPASAVEDEEQAVQNEERPLVEDAGLMEKVRYVLCYNAKKAEHDAAYRKAALEEAENELSDLAQRLQTPRRGRKITPQGVIVKAAEILTHRGMDGFFEVDFDGTTLTYLRKEERILQESWRDGKFIVKTNTELPAAEVVMSYKTLMRIEQAFRQIKNFLDVGPMYHWNERRVRGHIFVCVLAYLFEQELQVLYRRALDAEVAREKQVAGEDLKSRLEALDEERYTGELMVKELQRWQAMKAEFLGKTFVSVPPPPPIVEALLRRVGMKKPPKMILIHDNHQSRDAGKENSPTDGQMTFEL